MDQLEEPARRSDFTPQLDILAIWTRETDQEDKQVLCFRNFRHFTYLNLNFDEIQIDADILTLTFSHHIVSADLYIKFWNSYLLKPSTMQVLHKNDFLTGDRTYRIVGLV